MEYNNFDSIKDILKNTDYSLSDYKRILKKMQDDKSKEIMYNRIMLDNTNDAYYGINMQHASICGDNFMNECDKTMFLHGKFLLKNNNYKKNIYIIGFSNDAAIPRCTVWLSWIPLNVVCIFDDISVEDEYVYDATGGKYIDVLSFDKLKSFSYQDSVFIIGNSNYEYMKNILIKDFNIDKENIFVFRSNTMHERNFQYFGESFIEMGDNEVFVDGGAFDFYSSYDFSRWTYGRYKKIYSFEPVEELYELCKEMLDRYQIHSACLYNLGLWNKKDQICFDNLGSASRVNDKGEMLLQVDTIDNILDKEKATIIKLDIEGAEYEAIQGAEWTIRKYKPTLMICVYHKPNDILKLTNLILSYNKNYKIYARHYGYTIYETVLYFINK